MAVKATVAQRFQYKAIGKPEETINRVIARLEFPFEFEVDDEIIFQVENYYTGKQEIESYEHDEMQTVIKYKLGMTYVITYEEVV